MRSLLRRGRCVKVWRGSHGADGAHEGDGVAWRQERDAKAFCIIFWGSPDLQPRSLLTTTRHVHALDHGLQCLEDAAISADFVC
eukprot:365925-Chlamydomonas_euryale.AAC.16